jgi:hypothetical protein
MCLCACVPVCVWECVSLACTHTYAPTRTPPLAYCSVVHAGEVMVYGCGGQYLVPVNATMSGTYHGNAGNGCYPADRCIDATAPTTGCSGLSNMCHSDGSVCLHLFYSPHISISPGRICATRAARRSLCIAAVRACAYTCSTPHTLASPLGASHAHVVFHPTRPRSLLAGQGVASRQRRTRARSHGGMRQCNQRSCDWAERHDALWR